jgi:hypothetical protein
MQINLKIHDLSGINFRPELRNFDPEDIGAIIIDICHALEGFAEFKVSGFGDNDWPVDVRTDLAVCIEQIPNLLEKLKKFEECSLDFYEQGIEREIIFLPQNGNYILLCNSTGDLDKRFQSEIVDSIQLIELFSTLLGNFLKATKELDFAVFQKKIFRDWLEMKS